MPNASDLAADEIRAFSVDLERFSADIRNRALEFLRKLEEELIALLRKHDLGEVTLTSAKQRRMEKLLEQTQATIATAYAGIRDEVKADLREVAALSAANAGGSINAAVGVDIATTALAPERIRALADDTLVMGAPTRQWWSDQAASVLKNFRDQVQRGYASGEGVDEIVRRIRGTRALNYADGTMNIARRNAEALVRSSVQAISNSARNETFDNNSDVIGAVQQISTMDSRTTVTCMARSNQIWDLETKKPIDHSIPWNGGPPLHWNCRSVTVAVLKPLSGMPVRKRDAIQKNGTQAAVDGPISADMDYEQFLKGRSVQFQKDALGPGRWELWQEGRLTLAQMLDQSGNPMSLSQLKEKYGTK